MSSDKPVIAVVDDDRSVCTGVQRLLRAAGFETTSFTSGIEFLESLTTTVPDCVVLDLTMPVIDGLAVQARMTGDGLRVPVIFISATEQAELRRAALAAGAVDFLQKPFDGQVLLDTIASALRAGRV